MTTKLNFGGGKNVLERRTRYRYAVYEHRCIFDEADVFVHSFIVVKNQYDVIVSFTNYHKYIDTYEDSVCIPFSSNAKSKMYFVCMMLNYILIEHYDKYKVGHIFSIEKSMLDDFFYDYAQQKKPNGDYRGHQSIMKCVSAITAFFRRLNRDFGGYMKLSYMDLYTEKTTFSSNGKLQKKLVPNFKVRTMHVHHRIFRDIPTKVFEIILNQAFCYMPDIAFAICMSAFAGLRPGEVCNVRQEDSPLGKGIKFISVSGVVKAIEIDLRNEYMLRSDGVKCGGIKKERFQRVYPAFIPAFCKAYEFHKAYIKGRAEERYCPMFVGKNGMAMTYADYRGKFQKLITDYVRPTLLKHREPECQLYGQLLYENNLGPHALRHFYTVQLVLMGEDVAGIQYWRGDSKPESALRYLQNKGDLIKELSETNNLLADFMLKEGGILYGKSL